MIFWLLNHGFMIKPEHLQQHCLEMWPTIKDVLMLRSRLPDDKMWVVSNSRIKRETGSIDIVGWLPIYRIDSLEAGVQLFDICSMDLFPLALGDYIQNKILGLSLGLIHVSHYLKSIYSCYLFLLMPSTSGKIHFNQCTSIGTPHGQMILNNSCFISFPMGIPPDFHQMHLFLDLSTNISSNPSQWRYSSCSCNILVLVTPFWTCFLAANFFFSSYQYIRPLTSAGV